MFRTENISYLVITPVFGEEIRVPLPPVLGELQGVDELFAGRVASKRQVVARRLPLPTLY